MRSFALAVSIAAARPLTTIPQARPTKSRAGIVGLTLGEQKRSEPGCVIALPRRIAPFAAAAARKIRSVDRETMGSEG
jgi:hypothetical protein